jgi:hypothetical protein
MLFLEPLCENRPKVAYRNFFAEQDLVLAQEGLVNGYRMNPIPNYRHLGCSELVSALQGLAGEGAIAGVIFSQFLPEQDVLEKGEGAVEDVFIQRHAAMEGAFPQGTGAEDALIDVVGDEPGHRGDQLGGILVIRMEHDDDVGANLECFIVAGFLVAAIASVLFMSDDMVDAEFFGHGDGVVPAIVIYEDDFVDDIEWDLRIGLTEGKLCIVGR